MSDSSKLVRVLSGEVIEPPPIWIMRQAGRYLPEYRALRSKVGSFLDLCLTPELAAEVTLQPVRRFDFDAAIVFSDILVVPHALGQKVEFIEGSGPVLETGKNSLALNPNGFEAKVGPVLETVRRVRTSLSPEKTLIGFCGAPWTVATYMVQGRTMPDQIPIRRLALANPDNLQKLIDLLIDVSARFLIAQLEAGADVVKIFDSWTGILDDAEFRRWSVQPVAAVVKKVRAVRPDAKIIAFPRGAGARLTGYAERTGVDAIAVDWTTSMKTARILVRGPTALQGNLDPLRVVVGGRALDESVDEILASMQGRPHVFNLGHGITPDTPVAHVEQLIARVRRAG